VPVLAKPAKKSLLLANRAWALQVRRGRAGRELPILFAKEVSEEVSATQLNCNVRSEARWHRRKRSVRRVNDAAVGKHLFVEACRNRAARAIVRSYLPAHYEHAVAT